MVDNNNLVFKTFDEGKRYLIANPGGSIVRLDNNQGFNTSVYSARCSTFSLLQGIDI